MVKYCEIFWSFFKVGTFTIGGGYAMIPLMRRELVERHGWLTDDEFLDHIALSQAMPGVFAVNMASVTGRRLRGVKGAAAAIAGNILMPIVFILLLAMFFSAFSDNVYVRRIFNGLRPAVVALIAAPVFTLWKKESSKWGTGKWITVAIPVVCALAICLLGVSPVIVVIMAALCGYIYSQTIYRRPR